MKRQGKTDALWTTSEQWDRLLGRYAAIVDSPSHVFVAELAQAYPDAKVVLTVRDTPEIWLESFTKTIFEEGKRMQMRPNASCTGTQRNLTKRPAIRRAISETEGGFYPEPQAWWYTDHIDYVREIIPPERLLLFNLKDG
ncbi:hypothetical protein DOTSEDRAFT_57371 [Dothistroma septosporum NZE10]|uniref:Sulfotransferase family protein n=1 Tax=Dothistroma septosporum (strain NZE10 / CBS 128990) TaxID=675120 RepID=N1PBW9_DOTSN|nr:hypothetical protein DOTSEDRAFT_57371 [Dothistroma septosporum NZE10]